MVGALQEARAVGPGPVAVACLVRNLDPGCPGRIKGFERSIMSEMRDVNCMQLLYGHTPSDVFLQHPVAIFALKFKALLSPSHTTL